MKNKVRVMDMLSGACYPVQLSLASGDLGK